MPEFTTDQWAVVGLVLVLGIWLGLMLRSGGRKWRRSFEAERALRIAAERARDTQSARIAELEDERDRRITLEKERDAHAARIATAHARIAELERDRPVAIGAGTAGSIATAASGQRDDLSRIYGIGRSGEQRLNDIGIHLYAEIINLSPREEAALEGRLGATPGTIAEERWREQADLLKRGAYEEHAKRFA